MKNKIIIAITAILVILVIVSLLFWGVKPINQPSLPTIPIFTAPSITPSTSLNSLEVISIDPKDSLKTISVATPITVNFNQSLNQESFHYIVEPQIETYTVFSGSSVTFRSKTGWPIDQDIVITITSAKSSFGLILNSPYIITAKAPLPTE